VSAELSKEEKSSIRVGQDATPVPSKVKAT
jgi:hypothetical protein